MPRKQPAKKHAGGRPSAYREEFAEQARKLCLLGATDAQLGEFFGVSEQTINAWKQKHDLFAAALKSGKDEADARVAHALFHRALGYSHTAVKILTVADGGNQGSHIEQVEYIEKYPPDTTACIFWLKNRQKDAWRDKHEMEHGATDSLADLMRAAFGGATA